MLRAASATSRSTPATDIAATPNAAPRVTGRSFTLGLLLAAGCAALNCRIATLLDVHFLGGVQMPFGAVFTLLFFILAVNPPLRALHRYTPFSPFSAVELLTIYSMLLFAALVSTPGCDNFFLTIGPALFYFSTRENGWAALFYNHVPPWFAPGWDGKVYQQEVINRLYQGGVSFEQIPWHAWGLMLGAWSLFLLLVYGVLFFLSLLLRRQWIEHEALAFPLVQVPLQMVDVDSNGHPPTREFWGNRALWCGFALALALHLLHGLHFHYPDWPALGGFSGNKVWLRFTERPWTALAFSDVFLTVHLGAIGIAYLLTREVAFSFWFFFLIQAGTMVLADQLGFPAGSLPRDAYLGRAAFITFQSEGGWAMLGVLLLWTARHHFKNFLREAFHPSSFRHSSEEPFSPRFVLLGFVFCCGGLIAWCWFSGISALAALLFFAIYGLTSLVLARLVIEGGLLFPQLTFSPLEWMTPGLVSAPTLGAASLTKLAFLQPPLMSDMRTNLLPGFLHTLKIAHEMKLERRDTRRLLGSVAVAIIVALGVTIVVSLWTLYGEGGLSTYKWFTQNGPRQVFNGTAKMINNPAPVELSHGGWMAVGAAVVWLLSFMRGHFGWFPLHPLGFIVSSSFPMTQLWVSFFLGWAIKSLLLKYGGQHAMLRLRPFMIGLILGNLSAMLLWVLFGFWKGSQLSYWPA